MSQNNIKRELSEQYMPSDELRVEKIITAVPSETEKQNICHSILHDICSALKREEWCQFMQYTSSFKKNSFSLVINPDHHNHSFR